MLSEDQKRILGYFIEEAKDHLNTIEQGLLNLQATIQDAEMMNEVFRAAHSVKGGAAMLGLNSIQLTSHRLEDFFKLMKESPIQTDRDLESMLLQIFDGLQEQLEHLQAPYGLSDEQAETILTTLEPVFAQAEGHLQTLLEAAPAVDQTPPAKPATVAAMPAATLPHPETSALQLVFQSDVPALLRDMLTTFKKPDNESTREELLQICQRFLSIGDQFELNPWIELVSLATLAVANPQQTFRTLAPVIIKDVKWAQDLVLAGHGGQVAASEELLALVPNELQDLADESALDALLAEALDDHSTGEVDLAELFAAAENEDATPDLMELDNDSWFEQVAQTEMDDVDDLEAAFDSLTAEALEANPGSMSNASVGAEVGAAELNSLADLFEGDPAGLEAVWEEEEFADGALTDGAEDEEVSDLASDLADLLQASESSTPLVDDLDDDLISLFGQSLDEDSTDDLEMPSRAILDSFEPVTAIEFPEPSLEVPAPAEDSSLTQGAAENEDLDDFFAVDGAPSPMARRQAAGDLGDFFSEESAITGAADSGVVSQAGFVAEATGGNASQDADATSKTAAPPASVPPPDLFAELPAAPVSGPGDGELDALFDAADAFEEDGDDDLTVSFDALLEDFPAGDDSALGDGAAISAREGAADFRAMFDELDLDDLGSQDADANQNQLLHQDIDFAIGEEASAVDEDGFLAGAQGADSIDEDDVDLDLIFDHAESDSGTTAQGGDRGSQSDRGDSFETLNGWGDTAPNDAATIDSLDLDVDIWASDETEITTQEPEDGWTASGEDREQVALATVETDGGFSTEADDIAVSSPETDSGDGFEFDALEDLLDAPTTSAVEAFDDGPEDNFDDLEDLLDAPAPMAFTEAHGDAAEDDFDDLEALLAEEDIPSATPVPQSAYPGDGPLKPRKEDSDDLDEFSDLEKLLEDTDQLGGSSPTLTSRRGGSAPVTRRTPRRAAVVTDQTMRVSVSHLDILSNLVGELVVNRNSLEQDQERMRQFLDNLLLQVQQLNDVGQRMRDLYERSLLESSLISSRQSPSNHAPTNGSSHATGATFDALEMDRFTGFHTLSQEMIELIVRVREAASDVEFTVDSSDQITRQFRQVTTQLQEGLNKARMVPFGQTADRLPRAVRDISLKCGKEAKLVVDGRDTLIDKMILERLYDPVTHLVNNAITHGIEPPAEREAQGKLREGTITIRAFYQGNQTVIYIADDGGGINPAIVKEKALQRGLISPTEAQGMSEVEVYDLLFLPGFSTRDHADDLSGRGVGMDVVRTALADIRGAITIESNLGQGTSFTIRLPLTLSITKALSCVNNQARIAFPMDGVEDMFDVPRERVQTNDQGTSCILWRDTLLPFRPLSELLQFNRSLGRGRVYGGGTDDTVISIVVLRSASTFIGLQVDQVIGEQEIVIKQLEGPVPKPTGIAGATVMGDGRVMPIADVLELIDLSMGRVRREPASSLWASDKEDDTPIMTREEPTVLIVDDSITVRELLSMSFNKVGYRVEQARDGQEAWEKLRSGLPCDLVFCDIEMPRMDGLELLSRLQKDDQLSRIPIAMLTSRGADRHRQMAVDLGASGYFTKPYLEEMLLDAAQRMLNGENMIGAMAVADPQEA